jgi:hypothetical protein
MSKRIDKLKSERKKRIREASEDLLDDRLNEAQKKLDWVETSDKLIKDYGQKPILLQWPVIVSFLSILLIILSMTIHIPRTRIHLDVVTNAVSFTLDEDWKAETKFRSGQFYVDNLNTVNAGGIGYAIRDFEEPFSMKLKGNIMFSRFQFRRKAEVKLEMVNSRLSMSVKEDSIVSSIEAYNGTVLKVKLPGEDPVTIHGQYPETVAFSTNKSISSPITMKLMDTSAWQLKNISVMKVQFLDEKDLAERIFKSTIISGNLKILETGKEFRLEEEDHVFLKVVKSSRFKVQHENGKLRVRFEGLVSRLSQGPRDYVHNIKPTVIEYLYYQELWALVWSAILVLSGILWGIKTSLLDD